MQCSLRRSVQPPHAGRQPRGRLRLHGPHTVPEQDKRVDDVQRRLELLVVRHVVIVVVLVLVQAPRAGEQALFGEFVESGRVELGEERLLVLLLVVVVVAFLVVRVLVLTLGLGGLVLFALKVVLQVAWGDGGGAVRRETNK